MIDRVTPADKGDSILLIKIPLHRTSITVAQVRKPIEEL